MAGAHPEEDAISVPKPLPRTTCPDRNHPTNWQLKSGVQAGYRLHTQEPAEVLLPSWRAPGRPPYPGPDAGSLAESTHQPKVDSWAVEEPNLGVQAWGGPQGSSPCRDRGMASWLEAVLCFQDLPFISATISTADKNSSLVQMVDLSLNSSLKIWAPLLSVYYQDFTWFL